MLIFLDFPTGFLGRHPVAFLEVVGCSGSSSPCASFSEEGVLEMFPGKTAADLYVEIISADAFSAVRFPFHGHPVIL